MIFDTHAHYDDSRYDEDREEILSDLERKGVCNIINIGADIQGCRDTVAMAATHDLIFGAVGIHPEYADQLNEENYKEVEQLSYANKIIAIGEIGLDYSRLDEFETEEERIANKELQKKWFRKFLALARERCLPVVIHSRDASLDTLDIMREHTQNQQETRFTGGVIHCFSYSPEVAMEYICMGYYLGIGGVITFKNAKRLPEVVAMMPLERLLLETDCPYLAPVPYRGKRNESKLLRHVVDRIAEIRGISPEEVETATTANARRFMNGIS